MSAIDTNNNTPKCSNSSTIDLDTIETHPCWIHAVSFILFVIPTLNSVACAYSLLLTTFKPASNAQSYVKWMNVTLIIFVIQGMLCGIMLPLIVFHRCGLKNICAVCPCVSFNNAVISGLITTVIFAQFAAFIVGIVALMRQQLCSIHFQD